MKMHKRPQPGRNAKFTATRMFLAQLPRGPTVGDPRKTSPANGVAQNSLNPRESAQDSRRKCTRRWKAGGRRRKIWRAAVKGPERLVPKGSQLRFTYREPRLELRRYIKTRPTSPCAERRAGSLRNNSKKSGRRWSKGKRRAKFRVERERRMRA